MAVLSLKEIAEQAAERKERLFGYMTHQPPYSMTRIAAMEGMNIRSVRMILKELERERGVEYFTMMVRTPKDQIPFGLTNATLSMRQKLGDHLFMLRERGVNSEPLGRNAVSPVIGVNVREQIKAEQRPFNHDWKLSQIERLARQLGRDPREFMLSCLTT